MTSFKKDWKYYLGITFLVLSFLIPAIGFIFPFLGLPTALAAILIGVFTVGIPEVMIILAVFCLGKETFNFEPILIKNFSRLFGSFVPIFDPICGGNIDKRYSSRKLEPKLGEKFY